MPRAKRKAPAVPYNTQPQPVTAPTGLPYGDNQAATQAQRAAPLAGTSEAIDPQGLDQNALAAAQQYQVPPADLAAPTARPNEPVTAGVVSNPPDLVGAQLRALYAANPNNDILRLIDLHDRGW